ncbi:uncharacterized protein LOC115878758 [Sitophilus oryzae]|uniref:Uncharacterized protein LOC115878758 n=1 Tax=Sitophilus oryzae TaxID=7048 RepID=A0A6J2XIT5_SITOR|nr:uncharacterized protein LOC115878758 [Sitophilus oryzae]
MDRNKSDIKCDEPHQTIIPTKAVKRPFDVAFLMLPDEKLVQKNNKISKNVINLEKDIETCFNNNDEDEEVDIEETHCEQKVNHQKFFTQKQQIFDDPNLIKNKNYDGLRKTFCAEQKSAFTKVNMSKESRLSPNLSLSPDLSYQNSLSPSPPIMNRNYQNFLPQHSQNSHLFKSQTIPSYQTSFIPENFPNQQSVIESHFLAKNSEINFQKLRPTMYRPELPYNYQQFPNQELLKISSSPDIRHPAAAAILTSLLPPSLAALSLPAQNVCAKCNITFRMTSDLVYHMRSHHKNDSNDMNKRRREEKLKCPVCAESFRERHHLTRHMTAHQDKEDDDKDKSSKKEAV